MAFQVQKFYKEKSIQKSFNFSVTFYDNIRPYLPDGEQIPAIEDWHVVNVSIPFYDFKKEVHKIGSFPITFPVLDFDGFELKIIFEEDDKGTIAKLINWLQRRIITNEGFYVTPNLSKIIIDVIIRNDIGKPIQRYSFKQCYFLKSSEVVFDYSTNDSIKYEIIFGSDYYEFEDMRFKES